MTFRLVVLALFVLSLLVAGCAGPGQGIAERIRAANSPIVREVQYYPQEFPSSRKEHIYIFVVDEATEAEVLQLWCDVVLPAGAAHLPNEVALLKDPSRPTGVFRDQYHPPALPRVMDHTPVRFTTRWPRHGSGWIDAIRAIHRSSMLPSTSRARPWTPAGIGS